MRAIGTSLVEEALADPNSEKFHSEKIAPEVKEARSNGNDLLTLLGMHSLQLS